MDNEQSAGPGQAFSRFRYKLTKDGRTIFSGQTQHYTDSEPFLGYEKKIDKMRIQYNESLVKALAETFKANIKQVSNEVNAYFKSQANKF